MMLLPSFRAPKGLVRLFKSDLIEFYCAPELFGVIPEPVPAMKRMPDWFKKTQPVIEKEYDMYGAKALTAKRCMPLIDGMSAGWTIPLFGDMNVRTNEDGSLIEVSTNPLGQVADFHGHSQSGNEHSPTFPGPAVKFINPWAIRTAPGVSLLIIPPMNHFDKRFTCFGGLVDTDGYPKSIHFPAVWHMKDYDDIVEVGTPLVTVIPVRRADLAQQATVRKMTPREAQEIDLIQKKQMSRRGVYSRELREPRK